MADAPATPAAGKQTNGKNQAPPVNRPFICGSAYADDFSFDKTTVIGTSTVKLDDYELDTDGYTAGLVILAENTAANATQATTATFGEDGPFRVYESIELKDTNNKSIIGPMNGHDLYLLTKYGGYSGFADAKQSPIYSVTSGTGATAGSFSFALYVPIEIRHRDALGSLTNKSASTVFRLSLTQAGSANVYASSGTSAVPSTPGSLHTRVAQFGWMDSNHADILGNATSPEPPGINTIQYLEKETFTFSSGAMKQRLNSFSGGLRTLIFEMRNSTGLRSTYYADWPDPAILRVDKTTHVNRLAKIWQDLIYRMYGYTTAEVVPGVAGTPATEGGHLDFSVFPLSWARDFGHHVGNENGFGYLWVNAATALYLEGSVGSTGTSHTFNVLKNYVNPAGGNVKALTGGR